MYQRSAKFDAAVIKSHKMVSKLDLYVNGAYKQALPFSDAQVTIDDVAFRRHLEATLVVNPDTNITVTDALKLPGAAGNYVSANSPNVLSESSFEDGVSTWALSGAMVASISTDVAYHGTHSLKAVATGPTTGAFYDSELNLQQISVLPGETWTFSVWCYNLPTEASLVVTGSHGVGSLSLVEGTRSTWARYSLTMTNGLLVTMTLAIYWSIQNLANGVVRTFYIDAVQYEKSSARSTYTPSLNISGDIDIRAKIAPVSWSSGSQTIVGKDDGNTSREYIFALLAGGTLRLNTSRNATTWDTATSSIAVPFIDGSIGWVRAYRSASTGTVTFYTSTDGVVWSQLGTTVATTSGNLADYSQVPVRIGTYDGTAWPFNGKIYKVDVRNGFNDTSVLSPNFAAQAVGTTSFTDEQGNVWTINRSGTPSAAIIYDSTTTTLIADPLIPTGAASDLIGIYGQEIRAYRGIDFLDGTQPEYIPVGVFNITEVETDDTGESIFVRIQGYDRARRIARARLTDTYSIASGTNVKTALTALLQFRYPQIQFSAAYQQFATTATTNGVTLDVQADPWAFAQQFALDTMAADLYFDPDGFCTLVAVSDPNTRPIDWYYDEGSNSILLYVVRNANDNESYNHVILAGEHPDNAAPIRGEAYDSNASSPTYINGPFGDVPYFESIPTINTTAQANATALARLNKVLGSIEEVRIDVIAHPAHEVGDIVHVGRSRANINAVYVLDKITVPLTQERPLFASTRKRRVSA